MNDHANKSSMNDTEPDIRDHLSLNGVLGFDHICTVANAWEQDRFVRYLKQPVLIGSVIGGGRGRRHLSDQQFIFPFLPQQGAASNQDTFVIGRSLQESHLIIPDPSIRGQHVKVELLNSGLYLTNLSEDNRVLVNGEKIPLTRTRLFDGDAVCLGRYLFRLLKPASLYQLLQLPSGNEGLIPPEEDFDEDGKDADPHEDAHFSSTKMAKRQVKRPVKRSFNRSIVNEILENPCQDQEILLQCMDRLSFFDRFTSYQKKRLLTLNAQILNYAHGHVIIQEGEMGEHLFIVLKGVALAVKRGKAEPLREMEAGSMFGEVAYLTPEKRSVSVIAKGEVTCLMLGKNRLAFMGVEIRDRIQSAIVDKLLVRLADQDQKLSRHRRADYYQGPVHETKEAELQRGTLLAEDADHAAALLKQVEFFAPFSDYERLEIAKQSTHLRRYSVGQIIIRQGDSEQSLFILLKGEVTVIMEKKNRNVQIRTIPAGAFFGENSFLSGDQRTANVVAMTESVALTISSELLTAVGVDIREKIRRQLIVGLIQRMMDQTREIVRLRLE